MSIFQQGTASNHIDMFDRMLRLVTGAGTVGTVSYTGTGDGALLNADALPDAPTETWTVTCTAAATDGGTFSVAGSVSGAQADATVGQHYDNGVVMFDLTDGAIDFQVGDEFTFGVTESVMPAAERWDIMRLAGVFNFQASSFRTDYEPFRPFKGSYHNHTNAWRTAIAQHTNCWLSWESFRPYEITRFQMKAPGDATEAPKDFELQWSDDRVNWFTRQSFTEVTWSNNEVKEWTLGGASPGAKRYYRVYVTANNGDPDTTGIQEILFPEFQNTAEFDYCRLPGAWLKAPGLTGNGPVYLNFQIYDRPTDDYYNMAVSGATGFIDDASYSDQPGATVMALPMWNDDMAYWLKVDGQHVHIEVEVETSVLPCFAGKMLPCGTPQQYPYPLMIAAPLPSASASRYSSGSVSLPFRGNRSNLKLRGNDGTWLQPEVWPFCNNHTFRDTGGEHPLLPLVLFDNDNTYGFIQDTHHVTGFSNAAGNTVSAGAETHTVFRDGGNTGFNDYYTVRTA